MTTSAEAGRGLVACGDAEERRPDAVVASRFQIFQCGSARPLLEFDAIQTAVLRGTPSTLHVTETELWPFGPGWKWVHVPVYEWHLSSEDPQPQSRRTLAAARPAATEAEMDAFLNEYRRWLSVAAEKRSHDVEELVGRLFTAAVAGHPEAESLFLAMRADAGLDGAAAEAYSQAIQTYAAWRGARPRRLKG